MTGVNFDDPFATRDPREMRFAEKVRAASAAKWPERRRRMLLDILERCHDRTATLADIVTLAGELGLTTDDLKGKNS